MGRSWLTTSSRSSRVLQPSCTTSRTSTTCVPSCWGKSDLSVSGIRVKFHFSCPKYFWHVGWAWTPAVSPHVCGFQLCFSGACWWKCSGSGILLQDARPVFSTFHDSSIFHATTCSRFCAIEKGEISNTKAIELRELEMKFQGPLPEAHVDERCVSSSPARVPVRDVLTEGASSRCLTFCTRSKTLARTNGFCF